MRHILCMSGGKDSTALALYMRDRVQNMEYVFCDTDKELSETYEYLNRVEAFLGKKIIRLESPRLRNGLPRVNSRGASVRCPSRSRVTIRLTFAIEFRPQLGSYRGSA